MDNTIVAALIGVIGILLGALLGGYVSWFITKRNTERTILATFALNRIQGRDKAAATLRNEFLDLVLVLKGVIDLPNKDMPEAFISYLHSLYPKHASAVIAFIPYLNKTGVERINKAWFDYCFPNGITEDEYKKGKETFPLDDYAHISDPQKVALEKIETILSIGSHNKQLL